MADNTDTYPTTPNYTKTVPEDSTVYEEVSVKKISKGYQERIKLVFWGKNFELDYIGLSYKQKRVN